MRFFTDPRGRSLSLFQKPVGRFWETSHYPPARGGGGAATPESKRKIDQNVKKWPKLFPGLLQWFLCQTPTGGRVRAQTLELKFSGGKLWRNQSVTPVWGGGRPVPNCMTRTSNCQVLEKQHTKKNQDYFLKYKSLQDCFKTCAFAKEEIPNEKNICLCAGGQVQGEQKPSKAHKA